MIIYSTIENDVVKKLLFQRGYISFPQCEVHGYLREKKRRMLSLNRCISGSLSLVYSSLERMYFCTQKLILQEIANITICVVWP